MSHHLVEANDLSYSYPDGTPAVKGVSFRITHGESVAIIGANGAGKSTLLLHLNGCLMPTTGTLRVGDYPLNTQTLQHIRRAVGMVFQYPDDQLFMPTVFDDVAFGPLNLGCPDSEIEQRVMHALAEVGMTHVRTRPPYNLSAGEKRAVAIAATLSMLPDILVMDEPGSSLDPRARRRLIELLKTFKHTKIIATHDLDMAADLCERTLVMHAGKIAADGPTLDIFKNLNLLSDCGLELPLSMQGCPVCGK